MADHLLRLERAYGYLQQLDSAVSEWIEGKPYSITTQPNKKQRFHYVVLATAQPVPLDPFALLISDVLHNLRSGLDNLAYRLAVKFTSPLSDELAVKSEFPIFGDVDRKGNTGVGPSAFQAKSRSISGIDPAAKTIIESLQPYYRGNQFTSHPLWQLYCLSNIDKHRLLLPVTHASAGANIKGEVAGNLLKIVTIQVSAGLMKANTEVCRFGPAERHIAMQMNFQPTIKIVFPKGSVAENLEVVKVLSGIYDYSVNEVIARLKRFL